MRRAVRDCCMLALAVLMAGCGGGGAGVGEQRVCSADTFVPNYVRQLDQLLYWERFPVTVYFERDANYSDYYRTLALQGFDQWVEATGSVVRYREISNPDGAQIKVYFKPDTRNGLTTYRYYPSSGRLVSAKVEIGVQGNNPIDIRSIAAHEFGHALGIAGHSKDPEDMMFATYATNVPLKITQSYLNTVKTAYCSYFLNRTRRALPPPDETPVEATIVCGCSN
jgi:hypothetical protein